MSVILKVPAKVKQLTFRLLAVVGGISFANWRLVLLTPRIDRPVSVAGISDGVTILLVPRNVMQVTLVTPSSSWA